MANQATTRKFKVMTSGTTVDGRNVTRAQLRAMAAAYNPAVYGAASILSTIFPRSPTVYSARWGCCLSVRRGYQRGPLAGEAHLFREIEPAQRMKTTRC